MATTISLVAAGVGVSIVPKSMAQLQTHGVTYRQVKGPSPKAALSIVYREGPLSVVMQDFVDMVRRAASTPAGSEDGGTWVGGTAGGK